MPFEVGSPAAVLAGTCAPTLHVGQHFPGTTTTTGSCMHQSSRNALAGSLGGGELARVPPQFQKSHNFRLQKYCPSRPFAPIAPHISGSLLKPWCAQQWAQAAPPLPPALRPLRTDRNLQRRLAEHAVHKDAQHVGRPGLAVPQRGARVAALLRLEPGPRRQR